MELSELGRNPISEQEPAGKDVRYEPDFEALSQEVEKLSSPTARGAVDWQHIAELSRKILGAESKNLLVACYLCVAMTEVERLRGLALGIHILRDILENFWETMFPAKKRMKGRANALTWWKERTEASLATVGPETWTKEDRENLLSDLNAVNDFLGDNIEDAPRLNSLINSIGSLIAEEQEEPTTPPTREQDPAPAQERATPAPTGEATHDMGPKELLENGLDFLRKASSLLMEQNLFDSVVYRLNRIVAWTTVDSLPPSEGGKTLLPPPDGQIITALNNLYQSGNWRDLLETAESRIREFLFWLDLSRYTVEALEHLGHPEVAEIIARDTWYYTVRLPGLEKLCFSDGTLFADEETREWLSKLGRDEAGSGQAKATSEQDSTEQMVSRKLAEAEKKMKQNKLSEALTGLRYHMERSVSTRERFLWQIGLCRLLLRAKKVPLVKPYIEETLALLDEYKIEKWEPNLAVEALAVALSGLRAQGGEKDDSLMETITKRLSFLDPVKALKLI